MLHSVALKPSSSHPYTLHELIILSLYHLTTLISHILHALVSLVSSSSSVAASAPSEPTTKTVLGGTGGFFGNKHNVLNTVFVKEGWFWVSLLALVQLWTLCRPLVTKAATTNNDDDNTSDSAITETHRTAWTCKDVFYKSEPLRFLVRYAIVSLWFIFFTQWFFGLPIMDRVFVLTGGSCIDKSQTLASEIAFQNVSSKQCKAMGGSWDQGYDPSGHLFLISQASLFLWYEILGPCIRSKQVFWLARVTVVFMTVFWWMMVITNIYFHSFLESFAGLAAGYLAIAMVYHIFRNHLYI